ncbi:MAG TPA: phage holin family protein [Propionibacteriaceae bacterium]|nr:phage holin family protein [Propionibacteriaceae bacterium]
MAERLQVSEFIANITTNAKTLAQDIPALAKAEIAPAAKHAGIGGGLFGAAGYMAANAASLLFLAGGLALAKLFSWLAGWGPVVSVCFGFLAMALLLLILAAVFALIGKGQLQQVKGPEATIAETKATIAALSASVQNGKNVVVANDAERKSLASTKKWLPDER